MKERKKEQDEKVRATNDMQDLYDKFHVKNIDGYCLLIAEFVTEGALTEHLIQAGPHAGKRNNKQDWSILFFVWPYVDGYGYQCTAKLN